MIDLVFSNAPPIFPQILLGLCDFVTHFKDVIVERCIVIELNFGFLRTVIDKLEPSTVIFL
jgi:hypothetical protein